MATGLIFLYAAPSPLWYIARGSGIVAMFLLTATFVVGMGTTVRWKSQFWPKYLTTPFHRNLSLLTIIFLLVHIVTDILDPYAKLTYLDALVPFYSRYRPLYLAMGVIAVELFVALVATSLLRKYIPYKPWRILHWVAFACWPLALIHSLGTGTDIKYKNFAYGFMAVVAITLLAMVFWRLSWGWPKQKTPRLVFSSALSISLVVLVLWMLNGPMAIGWAYKSNIPDPLTKSIQARVHPKPSPIAKASPQSSPAPKVSPTPKKP